MSASKLGQHINTLKQCVQELNAGTLDDKARRKWANSLREIANCWDPKQPMQPTQDQMKKAWKHLTHEVQALEQQGSEYLRLNKLKDDAKKLSASEREARKDEIPRQRVINGLLDAFYVHARELDEFLYLSGRGDKDTMLGEDFVPGWPQSRPASPLRQPALKPLIGEVSLRDEINKMICHLCYGRIDMYDVMCDVELIDRWPVGQTMKDMCVPLQAFAKHVDGNPDAKDFREAVRHFCELHG